MPYIKEFLERLPSELDGALITNGNNQRYFTDFVYHDGYLLLTRKKSYLITDFRYIEAAEAQADKQLEVITASGRSRSEFFTRLLEENNVKNLAFEDSKISYAGYQKLKNDLSTVNLVPLGNIIAKMQEFKNRTEIDKIIKAQRIAEAAFEKLLPMISPERTEKEIALELEFLMRKMGSNGSAFGIIAISGTASSMPHGVPRDVKLEQGFMTFDFGAVCDGYRSDMTRTVCIGKPTDEMVRVYDTVLKAQLAGCAAVKPGAVCREVDKVARDIIDGAGYAGAFGHSLGHGVGLMVHEAPRLAPSAGDDLLAPGHVVTVEPGIYLPGRFGVRIEDMMVVTENGAENITRCPKELITLCT